MNRTRSILLGIGCLIGLTIARSAVSRRTCGGAIHRGTGAAGQAHIRRSCGDVTGRIPGWPMHAVQGPDFTAKWGPRAANELYTYLVQSMPPTNPGALGEEGTLAMTAFLLQLNGAPAGAQPLTPRNENQISTLLTGPAGAPAPGRGAGAADGVPRLRRRWWWAPAPLHAVARGHRTKA